MFAEINKTAVEKQRKGNHIRHKDTKGNVRSSHTCLLKVPETENRRIGEGKFSKTK